MGYGDLHGIFLINFANMWEILTYIFGCISIKFSSFESSLSIHLSISFIKDKKLNKKDTFEIK